MPRPTSEFDGCECVGESDKAILVRFEDNHQAWIPKSQVDDDSEVYSRHDSGTLIISEWWADKEGL